MNNNRPTKCGYTLKPQLSEKTNRCLCGLILRQGIFIIGDIPLLMPTATPLLLRGSRKNNKYRNSLDLNNIPPRFVFRILQVNLTSETFLSVRANIGKSSENFGSTPKVFESTSEIFVGVRINFEIRRKTFLFSSYFILSGSPGVNQDNPSQYLKTIKDVFGRFGIFWFVVGLCGSLWIVLGSLWVVVDGSGWLWVVLGGSSF